MQVCYSCFKKYEDEYDVCPHCGCVNTGEPVEPVHLYPGTVLAGRYILGYAIGSGGFGIVYKALDTTLDRVVAVKEFYVGRLVTRAAGTKDIILPSKEISIAEFNYRKARFLAEARNMAKFSSHGSIVNVFEYFEENGTAYIVMEMLDGIALSDYLKMNDGKLDEDEAIAVAVKVGEALESLHKEKIIHCDIAPDNIFICPGNVIKVLDLGAARLADAEEKVIDIVLKPGYSPPEQYEQTKNLGPWTDIYALGATLYMMLTGVKPDESTNRKINDVLVPPRELNEAIPENLSNTVMKAMAVERHMRFKSVSEFLKAVNGEKKVVTLKKEIHLRKRRRFSGIVAAMLVAVIACGSVIGVYNDKKTAQQLEDASISVWFSVAEGSNEEAAIKYITEDFRKSYPNIDITLRAIPEKDYKAELEKAAEEQKMPNLFESSGLSDEFVTNNTQPAFIEAVRWQECSLLKQYEKVYPDFKRVPLGIEVPVAAVVTKGDTALNYTDKNFKDLTSFNNAPFAVDSKCKELIEDNYGESVLTAAVSEELFLNNEKNGCALYLTSTMSIQNINQALTRYTKNFTYDNDGKVKCKFIYEWSMGNCWETAETIATEKILSWMLSETYQEALMTSYCNDGQIPVNDKAFDKKVSSADYYAGLRDAKENFVFE